MVLLQVAGGQHQGRFPLLRNMVGFGGGGGEEATAFPTEGQGDNPGEAIANHLEKDRQIKII